MLSTWIICSPRCISLHLRARFSPFRHELTNVMPRSCRDELWPIRYYLPKPSTFIALSDVFIQIRKFLFSLPESPDTNQSGHNNQPYAQHKPQHIDGLLISEDSPSKTINHTNHRVDRINKSLFLRYGTRVEPDWGYVQPKLNDERNHLPRISILHVKRCNLKPWAKASQNYHQHKKIELEKSTLPIKLALLTAILASPDSAFKNNCHGNDQGLKLIHHEIIKSLNDA